MSRRSHVLVVAASLCAMAGLSSNAHAGTAIALYNPWNHGTALPGLSGVFVNEQAANRVELAHQWLYPRLGDLSDTDFNSFEPFYVGGAASVFVNIPWNLQNYGSFVRHYNSPLTQSPYRNLHLIPMSQVSVNQWNYFDPISVQSSALGSPGFTNNAGVAQFASSYVDTGIGSAAGSIGANGEIKLNVDIVRSLQGATPVAEGALQGTYTDTFQVNGPGPTVQATVSFAARATAPVLDFSKGDFFTYAVGYQASIYEVRQQDVGLPGGPQRVVHEHWAASDFYWMDARLVDAIPDPLTVVPDTLRIKSIGRVPPSEPGVTKSQVVLESYPGEEIYDDDGNFLGYEPDTPYAFMDVRERSFDLLTDGLPVYDDPLMPFLSGTTSGETRYNPATGLLELVPEVLLPTGVDLHLMVNFFVIAGCSDVGFAACDFGIDGSHTAGIGIKFADPEVSLSSLNGFSYPQTALVPEPETYALMLGGLALIGWVAKRRKR
jgi:hypothetical protein